MFKLEEYTKKAYANENSIIIGDKFRITLLTPKLIRLEYSKNNKFEDRKTKMVINRSFPSVEYEIKETKDLLKIITTDVTIRYDKKEFSSYGLSIELNGEINHPYKCIWHYGDKLENLGGTKRTLDFIDGSTELEDGILSKYGISVIKDTNSPVFTDDGWYKERNSNDVDIYVFAYKNDYLEALNDYFKLTGSQAKLPRYALGNWWSRYYAYKDTEYINLLKKFRNEKIPFSVLVMDMDWHLTDIPTKYGSSWTGYSWNRKLIKEPEKLLKKIKDMSYAITLNLHPSAGIKPHENAYEEFARALNIDYKKNEFIDFDYKSEKFFEKTFELLHYPNEKIGVNFWWIDWQQSPTSCDENEDPLWVLNHYYFNDNQKNNNLGLVFSRYSGPGSHRYPIGFSGDTVISWKSLDFQPYFTICASNIGYGWWSHDIGGHRYGYSDNELMLRWLQFGVFSPINRLHSANSEFLEKEPWNFPQPYCDIMKEYLRLRHRLIPYIYTMNIIASEENIPLIRPIYYYYPNSKEAYEFKNQYFFGDNLMIIPITKKISSETLTASSSMWLPEGEWYDIQDCIKYSGNRYLKINRDISKLGVFIKSGGIIPLAILEEENINDISNPKDIELIIASGSNGQFILKEDFIGKEKIKECAETKIIYNESESEIIINKVKKGKEAIPEIRNWNIKIYGVKIKKLYINGNKEIIAGYDENLNISEFSLKNMKVDEDVIIKIFKSNKKYNFIKQKKSRIKEFLKKAQTDNLVKEKIYKICIKNDDELKITREIINLDLSEELKNVILEILLA